MTSNFSVFKKENITVLTDSLPKESLKIATVEDFGKILERRSCYQFLVKSN